MLSGTDSALAHHDERDGKREIKRASKKSQTSARYKKRACSCARAMPRSHIPCFTILFGLLLLAAPGQAQIPAAPGDSQSVVSVVITGNTTLDPDTLVWDAFPLEVEDLPSCSVDSILNAASRGAGASPTTTPTPEPDDGGLAWYYILLIAIGGVLVVAAIAGLIWYGVNSDKKAKEYARVNPGEVPEPPAAAGRRAFPPPHPSSKVIQVPLVHLHYAPETVC